MKKLLSLTILLSLMWLGCDNPTNPPDVEVFANEPDIIEGVVSAINPSIILMRPHIVVSERTIVLTGDTDEFLSRLCIGDYIKIYKWWEIELLTGIFIETDVKFIEIMETSPPDDPLR